MATELVSTVPASVLQAIPMLIDFPARHFTVDYDRDADVLYISFETSQQATDSELTEEGHILRYRGDRLVGITVLNASAQS